MKRKLKRILDMFFENNPHDFAFNFWQLCKE